MTSNMGGHSASGRSRISLIGLLAKPMRTWGPKKSYVLRLVIAFSPMVELWR